MVSAGLSSVVQSLQAFRKGGLRIRQPGARQDPSFSRHPGYSPCDLKCEEMHRGQLSTDNTEGLVYSRNVTAEPAASAWGSSSSEISSSAGGVSWWVCV